MAKVPVAHLGGETVKLEVACTEDEIQRGLMFRQSMPEDCGMVFIFRPARPVRFWMRNCYIPLDMLFCRGGKIVKISADCTPCKTAPPEKCPLYPVDGEVEVSEVIEVNAGYAKRHGIKEGDPVNIELPGLGQMGAVKEAPDGPKP